MGLRRGGRPRGLGALERSRFADGGAGTTTSARAGGRGTSPGSERGLQRPPAIPRALPTPPPQWNAELMHVSTVYSQYRNAERDVARQWPKRP